MFQTVYKELSRKLEKYFLEGTFQEYLPSVRELCKQFDVSKNTVSKALHELENRGIVVIEPHRGIRLNKVQGRRQIKYHTVGIAGICGLPENFLEIMNQKYRKFGFNFVGFNILIESEHSIEWMLQLPIDGWILLNSSSHPRLLDALYSHNIPVIGCPMPGYEHLIRIEPDHYQAYYNIGQKLLAMGHKRIALIMSQPSREFEFYCKWIIEALKESLQEYFDPQLVAMLSRQAKKMFDNNVYDGLLEITYKFSALKEPPTVIIAEQWILYRMREIYEQRKMSVPEDISMYSISYPDRRDPFFDSAILREDHSVEIAIRKMLAILNGKKVEPEEILIPMTLFNGKSVKNLNVQL